MRAISPFVIFAVFDVQVLKCCRSQVYKPMFCTFINNIDECNFMYVYCTKTVFSFLAYQYVLHCVYSGVSVDCFNKDYQGDIIQQHTDTQSV